MGLVDRGLNKAGKYGNILRFQYFTESLGSVWDDERTVTQSGADVWISGVVHSIDTRQGSSDMVLLEQGRISYDDKKLYVNGSMLTTSGARVFTVMVGSPGPVYKQTEGAIIEGIKESDNYKKIYLRLLSTGSLE